LRTAQTAGVQSVAVDSIGGLVPHNLWLINAVAASIPATLVQVLAHLPGILSVIANKDVQIAAPQVASPLGAVNGWGDSWVTARRIYRATYALNDTPAAPAVYLPD